MTQLERVQELFNNIEMSEDELASEISKLYPGVAGGILSYVINDKTRVSPKCLYGYNKLFKSSRFYSKFYHFPKTEPLCKIVVNEDIPTLKFLLSTNSDIISAWVNEYNSDNAKSIFCTLAAMTGNAEIIHILEQKQVDFECINMKMIFKEMSFCIGAYDITSDRKYLSQFSVLKDIVTYGKNMGWHKYLDINTEVEIENRDDAVKLLLEINQTELYGCSRTWLKWPKELLVDTVKHRSPIICKYVLLYLINPNDFKYIILATRNMIIDKWDRNNVINLINKLGVLNQYSLALWLIDLFDIGPDEIFKRTMHSPELFELILNYFNIEMSYQVALTYVITLFDDFDACDLIIYMVEKYDLKIPYSIIEANITDRRGWLISKPWLLRTLWRVLFGSIENFAKYLSWGRFNYLKEDYIPELSEWEDEFINKDVDLILRDVMEHEKHVDDEPPPTSTESSRPLRKKSHPPPTSQYQYKIHVFDDGDPTFDKDSNRNLYPFDKMPSFESTKKSGKDANEYDGEEFLFTPDLL